VTQNIPGTSGRVTANDFFNVLLTLSQEYDKYYILDANNEA